MSVFDWLFRRNRKTETEPPADAVAKSPEQPAVPAATQPSAIAQPPGADAPGSPAPATKADPYGNEFLPARVTGRNSLP